MSFAIQGRLWEPRRRNAKERSHNSRPSTQKPANCNGEGALVFRMATRDQRPFTTYPPKYKQCPTQPGEPSNAERPQEKQTINTILHESASTSRQLEETSPRARRGDQAPSIITCSHGCTNMIRMQWTTPFQNGSASLCGACLGGCLQSRMRMQMSTSQSLCNGTFWKQVQHAQANATQIQFGSMS